MTQYYLGIDIGGTKVAVTLWSEPQTLVAKQRYEVESDQTPDQVLKQLIKGSQALLSQYQIEKPVQIGISAAGPIDVTRGLILEAPNLKGWRNVSVVQYFKEAFQVSTRLENDANAAGLAVWKYGAGQGHASCIYATMSTGIGGGIIVNEKLWQGFRGNAGEIGHMVIVPEGRLCGCGMKGCWEAYCGGKNVQKHLASLEPIKQSQIFEECKQDLSKLQFYHLADAVRKKDSFATDYLKQWTTYNAMALANLIYAYDPEIIVLGTIAYFHGELFMEDLVAQVKQRLWPVYHQKLKIVPTILGDKIGDYAALAVASLGT